MQNKNKFEKKAEPKRLKRVNQDFCWHYAETYIEGLRTCGNLMSDYKFRQAYLRLERVINEKIEIPYDIENSYVTVEYIYPEE